LSNFIYKKIGEKNPCLNTASVPLEPRTKNQISKKKKTPKKNLLQNQGINKINLKEKKKTIFFSKTIFAGFVGENGVAGVFLGFAFAISQ